ncbi:MAG TPA: hypothetical protein VF329_03435 [Gammaproteobacteria bacterium]
MIAIRDHAGDILRKFPAPAEPLPPRPEALYSPRYAPLEFERFAPRFRIRRPAYDRAGLIVARGVEGGDSLSPLIPTEASAFAVFDPSIAADDADLVLIRWHDDFARRIVNGFESEAPEVRDSWIRRYAADGKFTNLALKVLRHGGGRLWVTCRQYGFRLEDVGRVLGVCVALELDGVPAYGTASKARRFMHAWANNLTHPWRI